MARRIFPIASTNCVHDVVSARNCDLLLAVGSTLGVYPAAGVVPIAKRTGARLVILNAEPTEMDDIADAVLRGSIAEVLPPLVGMSTP